MNFCQTYFSKDLDYLRDDDLILFFQTPQKESQYLEFKSAREPNLDKVFTNTLKPGICSFLNSEGGLLIYGAPKEDKKNPEHPYHGPLQPYQKGFLGEHDTIIRKISDGIIPMPVGVRLKEIEFENGVVAVFEIQQSLTKPHQTENTYQIRIDGQKKPAPHYLIEAMMKQTTFPNIKIFLKANNIYFNTKSIVTINLSVFLINFSPFQNEKKVRYRMAISGNGYFFDSNRSIGRELVKHYDYEEHPILSFGEPIHVTKIIQVNTEDLEEESEIEILMTMHGELSPSKVTSYKVTNLKKDNSQREKIKLILDIDNLLFSEYQAALGKTNEQALKDSLGIDL